MTTVLTGNQIIKARYLALLSAMELEAKGIGISKGIDALAITKKEFNWNGSRQEIIEKLQTVIDSMPNTP